MGNDVEDAGAGHSIGLGFDADIAALESRADGDAVDAAFEVEVGVVGGFDDVFVDTAAPERGAGKFEIDAGFVGGAAVTLGVDRFDIEEGDISAVGEQAAGAGIGRQLEGGGGAGGF